MYQAINKSQRKYDPATKSVPLAGVRKYILFLTDKDITTNPNESCIVHNRNWPES
jgi:hypothetical protein